MTDITGAQFIAGERVAGGDELLRSIDARDGSAFATPFVAATEAEITQAAEAAAEAFGPYSATTIDARAAFLETAAEEIEALGQVAIDAAMRESALPEKRLGGEVARTTGQLRLFANVLRRGDWLGARIDRATDAAPDIRQMKTGVGPVAVFGASNFPFAFSVAGGDTASALAAGCPVVAKAHPGHMVTSELVASALTRAVERAGMPAGTFNLIFGDRVGAQLVQEPAIKAVGFTGSQTGGRALFDLAAARPEPIPVFAEMSSVNPVFMLPEALAAHGDRIARDLAGSVTLGAGQFCTGPGLILGVRSKALSQFIESLGDVLRDKPEQTMLGAGLLANYRKGLERLRRLEGVEEIATGPADASQAAARLFTAPSETLFDASRPLFEEVFGPCTVVVALDNADELRRAAAALNGQLTATVIHEENELSAHVPLIRILTHRVGRVLCNGLPTGVAVNDAIVHGGPYPATTDARGTSVGSLAIERYLRPVCYQNAPAAILPDALLDANPLGIRRLVDGEFTTQAL